MKGKINAVKRTGVALVLVVCMMVSMCNPIFAATAIQRNTGSDKEINYVSLGDSMSNGYGLDGYHGNTGVEDYGKESYANQFAKYLGANHAQLAMSAMRVEDLHWLLEVNYKDDEVLAVIETLAAEGWNEELWYSVFTNGDYWTWNELVNNYRFDIAAYCIEGHDEGNAFDTGVAKRKYSDVEALKIVAKYYQESVAKADIISLAIGNGNLGVFGFGRIMEAIGFKDTADNEKFKVENAIRECSPEMQAKLLELKAELYAAVESKMGMAVEGKLQEMADVVVYIGLSMALNYAGTMEAILLANPDAEIILVPVMNTFGEETKEVEGISLGDLMAAVVEPYNAYVAGLPTVMQAAQNETYKNAKVYYAEAATVECIVATYDYPLTNPTVRDRFVESIVGENGDGMVWELLAGSVANITLAEIEAYEALSEVEKLAYATTDADKAKSISMYLAFEKAIIAGKDKPVTIESVMGLGGLNASFFANIFGAYNTIVAEMFAANHVKVDGEFVEDAYISSAAKFVDTTLETIAKIDGNEAEQAAFVFINSVSGVKAAARYPGTAMKKLTATVAAVGGDENTAKGIYNGVIEQYKTAYSLLVTPDALSAALTADENIAGLLSLFARCIIGNGIGAHPSEAGHDALFEAVKYAYEEQYTAQKETLNNVIYYVTEYYDEAYEYAYGYAEANGYITMAVDGIDSAIAALNNVKLNDAQMTDAFKAEVAAEIAEIIETLEAAKALILEADKLDEASLSKLLALLNEAADDMAQLKNVLVQAGVDVNELVIIPALEEAHRVLTEEVIPQIKKDIAEAVEAGKAYLREKLEEMKNELPKLLVDAVKAYLPKVDEALYDYFYNNPEEVIAFFTEYGPYIATVMQKYGPEAMAVVGYVFYTYGEDMATYLVENHETVLAGMANWADKYGDKTIAMIQVYAEALGLCDAVREQIAELEAKLAAAEAAAKAEIQKQIAELEAKLEAADAAAKAEIQKQIAELKAKLESIETAAMAQIQKQIDVLKAEVAALEAQMMELVTKMDAAVKAEIMETIAKIEAEKNALKAEIEAFKAEIEAALGQSIDSAVATAIEKLEALVDELNKTAGTAAEKVAALVEKLVYDATHGEYIIENDSYFVALGDSAAYADKLAAALEMNGSFKNLSQKGMTAADILAALPGMAGEISKADLITIGISSNAFAEFALNQVINATSGDPVVAMDWSLLMNETGAKYAEEILAELRASLLEEGLDEASADLVMLAVESYAYAYIGSMMEYTKVLMGIQSINPEALVVIVGMNNGLAGLNMNGIAMDEYIGKLIDVANAYTLGYAVIAPNTVYVDAPAVEVKVSVADMTLPKLLVEVIRNGVDNLYPTDAGYEYICEQIMNALTIVDNRGLLGDADGNGVVNALDASLILQYYTGKIDASELNLAVCELDGNGVVNALDASLILEYYTGKIAQFPVEAA